MSKCFSPLALFPLSSSEDRAVLHLHVLLSVLPFNLSDVSFPLSITDSSSLDFLPLIPSPHKISKRRSFQSWQEVILIHEDEVQVRPSLHNLF